MFLCPAAYAVGLRMSHAGFKINWLWSRDLKQMDAADWYVRLFLARYNGHAAAAP
jgi:hypothetical protein